MRCILNWEHLKLQFYTDILFETHNKQLIHYGIYDFKILDSRATKCNFTFLVKTDLGLNGYVVRLIEL